MKDEDVRKVIEVYKNNMNKRLGWIADYRNEINKNMKKLGTYINNGDNSGASMVLQEMLKSVKNIEMCEIEMGNWCNSIGVLERHLRLSKEEEENEKINDKV
jgi:translation elongation factor EF-1beta